MHEDRYLSQDFGWITSIPGDRWSSPYFLPKLLPRAVRLSTDAELVLSEADAALGVLAGLSQLIQVPELLLGPSLTGEAVASCHLDGVTGSLSAVLSAESERSPRDQHGTAVTQHLAATMLGTDLVGSAGLGREVLQTLQQTLVTGESGGDSDPWRTTGASPGSTAGASRFVPPHPSHLHDLVSDWESFAKGPVRVPTLVTCALLLYQFETIQPFVEANGRLARLLVPLTLIAAGRLSTPNLFLSPFFETHREQYDQRLQAVRERGELDEWIRFFCEAVAAQSIEGAARVRSLVELRGRYRREARAVRYNLTGLIDIIFTNPFVTVRSVEERLRIAQPTASSLLRNAENRGWLVTLGRWGRGGRERWIASEIWGVIGGAEPG